MTSTAPAELTGPNRPVWLPTTLPPGILPVGWPGRWSKNTRPAMHVGRGPVKPLTWYPTPVPLPGPTLTPMVNLWQYPPPNQQQCRNRFTVFCHLMTTPRSWIPLLQGLILRRPQLREAVKASVNGRVRPNESSPRHRRRRGDHPAAPLTQLYHP